MNQAPGRDRAASPPSRRAPKGLLRCGGYLAVALAAAAHAASNRFEGDPVRDLDDEEVAIVHTTAGREPYVVEGPAKLFELPVWHEVRVLRRSPVPLSFEGDTRESVFTVPQMRLRAVDGSPMRFEGFSLRYALSPERAADCLEDTHGILERAARLVEAHARDVVRRRFGGYLAEQVVTHEVLVTETARCREELGRVLTPHGLRIVEFATPKPRFDHAYEEAVERRKVSNAEIERLRARQEGLDAERGERLASLEQNKQAERDAVLMNTASEQALAERAAIVTVADAEDDAAELLRKAESERHRLEQEAELLALDLATRAEKRRAEVRRTAALGRTAILEAWIGRFTELRFRVAPHGWPEDEDATRSAHGRDR